MHADSLHQSHLGITGLLNRAGVRLKITAVGAKGTPLQEENIADLLPSSRKHPPNANGMAYLCVRAPPFAVVPQVQLAAELSPQSVSHLPNKTGLQPKTMAQTDPKKGGCAAAGVAGSKGFSRGIAALFPSTGPQVLLTGSHSHTV